MSQLLISMSAASASGFKKNDRIIARVGRSQWHLGRVKSAGKTLKLVFDDGMTATVEPDDFKDVFAAIADTPENTDVLNTKTAKTFLLGKTKAKKAENDDSPAQKGPLKRLVPNR